MPDRAFFIVNPAASGGRTGRLWHDRLRARALELFPGARWTLTTGPGQAAALAAGACAEGADLVVAVGGDGTVNEVVNGLMGETLGGGAVKLPEPAGEAWTGAGQRTGLPALGVVPAGTGCDFVKSIGVPGEADGALDLLASGKQSECDLCLMTFAGADGGERRRYSMNMCGCGASGEVARRVNASRRPGRGILKFFAATAGAVASCRPRQVEMSVDGGKVATRALLGLFVCNGEYCGGGMRPGRGARVDDGALRVVEIGDVPTWRVLVYGYRLYNGRLEGIPGVRVYDTRSLTVKGPSAVLVDCDGEQPGTLPASYSVVRRAIRVVTGNRP